MTQMIMLQTLLRQDKVLKNRHLMCEKENMMSLLQFGFTFQNCKGNEQPLCLICNELLAPESMKPSKLKRHLESKHVSYVNKPKEYFERLYKSLNKEKNPLKNL